MSKDRLEEEQFFHDKRFGLDDGDRGPAGKYYSVRRGMRKKFNEIISQHSMGKQILEYGCGSGTGSERLLKLGGILTGIDISPEGVQNAKRKIAYTDYNANYFVMNAEDMSFDDDSFDVVVGLGILHHLVLEKAYNEISRVLKKDGHAVFEEPLGHNPIINLYRALTPQMRTFNEHPLRLKDIELLEKYFYNVKVEFFTLSTLLAVPFRKTFFFAGLYDCFERLDRFMFRIPSIRKYAWTAIIHASHPKK